MSSHIQRVQIDSRLRQSGTISSFRVELPNRGLLGTYELKAFNIYNSYCNVDARNNQFAYDANSLTGTITVPEGSYTILELAQAMKALLNTATSLVWTVTFSSITYKIVLSTTLPFDLNFNVANSIGFAIGFEEELYSSMANSLESVKQVGLSTQPMNYFISLKEANNEMTLLNTSSTTFIVPILTTLNQLNYYEPQQFRQFCSFTNETKYLTVSIFDHDNQLIDFQSNWYFILQQV